MVREERDREVWVVPIIQEERCRSCALMIGIIDCELRAGQLLIPVRLGPRDIHAQHVFQHAIDSLRLSISLGMRGSRQTLLCA